jgi:hypothetical protein
MEQLTPEGLKVVNELAQRYGFSQEAVIHMMFAMVHGRGGMAQFNHPEFAGSGQWMRGGMLMLADMFNQPLKARVDGLCQAIATELASQPDLFPSGSFQSQTQSGGGQQMQVGGSGHQMQVGGGGQQMQVDGRGQQGQWGASRMAPLPPLGGGGSLFTPDPRDTWWPQDLGSPSACGSQNDMRYAFFPAAGRLAVEANGQVTIYDTGGHHIAGFSQQQSPGGAVVFTTPGGSVSLASLATIGGGIHQQAQSSSGGDGAQQAQSSGGGSQQLQQQVRPGMAPMTGMAPMGGMAPMTFSPMTFSPMASSEPWWPADLGTPSSAGSQNDLRYALFPAARRLAVERKGHVTVHDIGDLRISGFSQTSGEGGVGVTTATGTVPLANLPVVGALEAVLSPAESGPEVAASPKVAAGPEVAAGPAAASPATPPPSPASHGGTQADVLDALSKLAELRDKGILTEAEFAAKKTELLSRL